MANTAFYQRVQVHSPNTHTRHSALLLWLRFDVTFFIFHTRSRLIRMHLFTHTHTHTYGNIVVVIVVYTGTLPVVVYKCVCECISECMCVWISLKKEFCRYFVYSASTKNQTTYLYTSKCMYMCTYVHTRINVYLRVPQFGSSPHVRANTEISAHNKLKWRQSKCRTFIHTLK